VRSRKALVLVVAVLLTGGAVVVAFSPTVTLFFIGTCGVPEVGPRARPAATDT
jgi:hypothetical protein